MKKKDTLLIDVSSTMRIIKDRLETLFHDDVFPDLVFELAMDSWNVKFICEDSDEVLNKVVKDKIFRYMRMEDSQKEDLILMIVSCIKEILSDIGNTIYFAIPKDISHIQFEKLDSFNNLHIKIVYDEFESEGVAL